MRALVAIIIIASIAGLFYLVTRQRSALPKPPLRERFVTLEQIPSVVAQLQSEGKNSSFAVFMFRPDSSESAVNLQYSMENDVVGLDWVLLSPRNISDKERISTFITSSGHAIAEREMNNVKYLRVEGPEMAKLGIKICSEFYQVASNEKIELLTQGFEWQP